MVLNCSWLRLWSKDQWLRKDALHMSKGLVMSSASSHTLPQSAILASFWLPLHLGAGLNGHIDAQCQPEECQTAPVQHPRVAHHPVQPILAAPVWWCHWLHAKVECAIVLFWLCLSQFNSLLCCGKIVTQTHCVKVLQLGEKSQHKLIVTLLLSYTGAHCFMQ